MNASEVGGSVTAHEDVAEFQVHWVSIDEIFEVRAVQVI
jgi:hypothetical protein